MRQHLIFTTGPDPDSPYKGPELTCFKVEVNDNSIIDVITKMGRLARESDAQVSAVFNGVSIDISSDTDLLKATFAYWDALGTAVSATERTEATP